MTRHRGYILLTVLLLLMLAAVAMASFCRLAISQSLQASAGENDLQRRWGTLSCREILLPNAENILETDETSFTPVSHVHADFDLGIEKFSIDICDEQAKANVNALYARLGKDRAEQAIAALVKSAGSSQKARLRSSDSVDTNHPSANTALSDNTGETQNIDVFPAVFGSWSEIFPGVQTSDLSPAQPSSVATNLTCWGNGAVNVHRASSVTLTQVCGPTLSPAQIAKLTALRTRLGDSASVDDLLAAAQISTADALNISSRLTTTSAVHSVWIKSQDHSAVVNSLLIRDSSDSDDVRCFSFQW